MGQQNPVDVSRASIEYAEHNCDVVIIDTAGRLHIDDEMRRIIRNMK